MPDRMNQKIVKKRRDWFVTAHPNTSCRLLSVWNRLPRIQYWCAQFPHPLSSADKSRSAKKTALPMARKIPHDRRTLDNFRNANSLFHPHGLVAEKRLRDYPLLSDRPSAISSGPVRDETAFMDDQGTVAHALELRQGHVNCREWSYPSAARAAIRSRTISPVLTSRPERGSSSNHQSDC